MDWYQYYRSRWPCTNIINPSVKDFFFSIESIDFFFIIMYFSYQGTPPHPCAVGCSDFHFFSYFWEVLTFPFFLGTQEFRKCKKNHFSSAVLSEFFWTFSKIYIFPNFSKLIFKVSIQQIFTKFSGNHFW
jgi:hypothetical protein